MHLIQRTLNNFSSVSYGNVQTYLYSFTSLLYFSIILGYIYTLLEYNLNLVLGYDIASCLALINMHMRMKTLDESLAKCLNMLKGSKFLTLQQFLLLVSSFNTVYNHLCLYFLLVFYFSILRIISDYS